jgi:hypothetical protein
MEKFNSYIIRADGDNSPAFCAKCGHDKPPAAYYAHSKRGDGATRYRPYCKECRVKGGRKNWARPIHTAIIAANTQVCKICCVQKPLDDFYANGCFNDGTKKYRSRCKKCVLSRAKQNQPREYATKSQRRSSSPKNFITGILNHAAKRKQHLGFDLDVLYVLDVYQKQNGRCALSGVEMTYNAGSGRVNTNISIDRIDSSVGYVRGNVQFVCDIVNRMKQDMSEVELLVWCARILKEVS